MKKLTSRTASVYLTRYHWDGVPSPEPTLHVVLDGKEIVVVLNREQLEMLHDASWRLMRSGK